VIDTHAHLDACTDPAAELLARARAAGVTRVLTVGTTIDSCRSALAAAEADDGVFAILGIHPHEAGGPEAERIDELAELLRHDRAVAVGETGLDHFRDYAPTDRQRALFERHLELARELEMAVVIHTRAAEDETLDALAGFDGTVVLHCFSSPALLPAALDRGWYVSFAGNVTYPKARDLRDAATQVPVDRLLAETDCPYLAPQPVRGRENEPAFVAYTIAMLAETRGEHPAGLSEQIDRNANAAFRLA
jgi:TatD DNase family protein